MDANGTWYGLMSTPPKVLIIGAGSRGNGYARAVLESTTAVVAAIAESIDFKRREFGRKYIWQKTQEPQPHQSFCGWKEFLVYEQDRRRRQVNGETVEAGIDAAFICVLDEQHAEIITALAPLKLHILSEKPLATTLDDCLSIYASLLPDGPHSTPETIFGIGHVLRYSPHNMVLRELLMKNLIGDIVSMQHTEPVGWWHFSHSYVRGNWRKERTTAPSLLTKSCHDIDLILWLLCNASSSQPSSASSSVHLPSTVSSSGHLSQFRRTRKPKAAGNATNCLSCKIEAGCKYSAKKIYVDKQLAQGNADWPVKIVNPEIEECLNTQGAEVAEQRLLESLEEDYTQGVTPQEHIDRRPWFGRCVWECDNDVCDDQTVILTWDEDPGRGLSAKTANFHMIANTEAQCERRGHIYGTNGEITYDSRTIRLYDFETGESQEFHPKQMGGGHGGGDDGLIQQFIGAVQAVQSKKMSVEEAQNEYIGCTLEDVIRSHAAVFAAEEARVHKTVVDWAHFWTTSVESKLMEKKGWHVVNSEVALQGKGSDHPA